MTTIAQQFWQQHFKGQLRVNRRPLSKQLLPQKLSTFHPKSLALHWQADKKAFQRGACVVSAERRERETKKERECAGESASAVISFEQAHQHGAPTTQWQIAENRKETQRKQITITKIIEKGIDFVILCNLERKYFEYKYDIKNNWTWI